MTLFINRTTPNGDLTLLSGEVDEVNYTKTGANAAVTTFVEFDEVTLSSVVDGVVRKDYETGAVAVAGMLNEADYFDEVLFTVPGTYTWKVPPGVSYISVICIGGGGSGGGADGSGGGGGGLGILNDYFVEPDTSYTVVVGAGGAAASASTNGNPGGDSYFSSFGLCGGGGGNGGVCYNLSGQVAGGSGGTSFSQFGSGFSPGGVGGDVAFSALGSQGGGGGGAGGYLGAGGRGANGSTTSTLGTLAGAGSNGGGGGGGAGAGLFGNGNGTGAGAGGGGVNVYGEGTSGAAGTSTSGTPGRGFPGFGGSGGTAGGQVVNNFSGGQKGGDGGLYGGGGGGASGQGNSGGALQLSGKGGDGAVRILWSTTGLSRSFITSTNIKPSTGFRPAEVFTLVAAATGTRSLSWNTQLTQRVRFTWNDALALQQFFQLGSYISFLPTQSGTPASTKDTEWASLINSIGNIFYTFDHYTTGGNVVVTERYSGGNYTANYYKVWGELFEANNSVVISALFDDATPGSLGGDTLVTVDISHTISYYVSQSPVTANRPTVTQLKSLGLP